MKAWFESLQPRERQLLTGGAVVVALSFVWLFVLDPIATGQARASDDIARKQQLIDRARRTLTVSGAPATGSSSPSSGNCAQEMNLLVLTSLRDAGLGNTYRNSSPFGNGGLRVSIENASFDQTVAWLGRLQADCGIEVDSGSFTNRNEPGRVDASIALERSRS